MVYADEMISEISIGDGYDCIKKLVCLANSKQNQGKYPNQEVVRELFNGSLIFLFSVCEVYNNFVNR